MPLDKAWTDWRAAMVGGTFSSENMRWPDLASEEKLRSLASLGQSVAGYNLVIFVDLVICSESFLQYISEHRTVVASKHQDLEEQVYALLSGFILERSSLHALGQI